MSTVQFRWKDDDGNTRIVGQFSTDWVFEKGKTFEFWGGKNEVLDVKVYMKCSEEQKLEVLQIVTILPYWYNESLHITPKEIWKDSQIIGK